jgi:hypothetical protein
VLLVDFCFHSAKMVRNEQCLFISIVKFLGMENLKIMWQTQATLKRGASFLGGTSSLAALVLWF